MGVYKSLLRPLLFSMDPETAHELVLTTLGILRPVLPLLKPFFSYQSDQTAKEFMGIKFPNRIGLAAGFDKNCAICDDWDFLGFGFVELGTVTGEAQAGNPKPRLFRHPDRKALVNRMGFNSLGAENIARRLKQTGLSKREHNIPIGINIGKTKTVPIENAFFDYEKSLKLLYPFADYFIVNVSSPNTPELRKLQGKRYLADLLSGLKTCTDKPLILKIAPDLSFQELDDIIDASFQSKINGIIATNTTATPDGGLSGRPLLQRSTEVLKYLRDKTGKDLLLIASGGIMDEDSFKAKIDAGADLFQIYTGLIYEGPCLPKRLNRYFHHFRSSRHHF